MTMATPPFDGPIKVDAPDHQRADVAAALCHPARLTALRRLALLDTPAEEAFDRLTRLTTKILRAPVAILSLVAGDRSFFKSSVGLPEVWASRREIPLSHSVCQHVVALNAPLVINDARAHPLVVDNQAVAELRIAAYMGVPLVTSEGHTLGTFAVIDTIPRDWTPDDVATLRDLAASAITEIELRAASNLRLCVEQRLDLLELVVDNATVAVLIAEAGPAESSDPRIVFVNQAYTCMTGYSPDEVVGRTHQVLNSSEIDRSQNGTIRAALTTLKPARLDFLTQRKDGSSFWAELNIVPIADKAGRYSHWVIIQRDISEQKAAAEALRRSEERYRSLVLASSQIVWITDAAGQFLEDSPTWRAFTGQTAEQAQGEGWLDAVHPDDRTRAAESWAKAVAEKTCWYVEYRVRTTAGEYRHTVARGVPILHADGRVREWVGTNTDITVQKLAEEAMRESEGRFARTVRGSGAGLWDWDLATNDAYLSPRFKELLGYEDAELANTFASFESHLHPEDHDRVLQETRDYLERGGLFNTKFRLRIKRDTYRWFEARGQAYWNEAGLALRMAGSLTDISDLKQTEMDLIEAKEAAETANQAKSEFFSRMSHELRTPLNAILGFGQLLEMDVLSAPQRESAEQIRKGGLHLLTLINEILDIARIEAGGTEAIFLEEVKVGGVVSEVLAMILPLADQARVRLLPLQPRTCDRVVRADLQRLKQVLLNLLSNATKYNREGGTVTVSCAEAAGAMLRISVTDTGPGIAPQKMHRLFAPFDRLEAEQKGVEGTGLGLTLSKGLVEAMQGTMGVKSSLGLGTTCWVELPRIDKPGEPAAENPAIVADPQATSGTDATVLYVEDNPANLRLVERIIELRPGVRLLSAKQGRLGIELARMHQPDMILLDHDLPNLQGDEVLRRLREEAATRSIPVIVLSAAATPDQVEGLLRAGASHYLVKPVQVRDLLRLLDEILSKRGR